MMCRLTYHRLFRFHTPFALAAALSVSTLEARAEPPPPAATSDKAAEGTPRWYGWQTLTVDGVALGAVGLGALVGGGANRSGSILFGGGFFGYFLGAPIVHVAHGEPGRGVFDVFTRGLVVFAGSLAGYGVAAGIEPRCDPDAIRCDDPHKNLETTLVVSGVVLGVAAASTIDATLLAWDGKVPGPMHLSYVPRAGGGVLALGGQLLVRSFVAECQAERRRQPERRMPRPNRSRNRAAGRDQSTTRRPRNGSKCFVLAVTTVRLDTYAVAAIIPSSVVMETPFASSRARSVASQSPASAVNGSGGGKSRARSCRRTSSATRRAPFGRRRTPNASSCHVTALMPNWPS